MTPQRSQCGSADPFTSGKTLAVFHKSSATPVALTSRFRSGAIPIQINQNTIELRDGSIEDPILLQNLQKTNAQSVAEILVRLPDGTIAAWNLGNFAGEKSLVIKDGQATAIDNYSSDLFGGSICEESDCANIEALVGVKQRVVVCPGQPDKIMWQMVRAPKCCCTEEDIESLTGQ